MNKDFVPPVSIEEFAAYLDGNLTDSEMNRIDALISMNLDMEEIATLSGEVIEDIQVYMQDEFAYNADMMALDNIDFDIPNLDTRDTDITPHIGTDTPNYKEVASAANAADEITDIDETVEEGFGNGNFLPHKDEDSISTSNGNNEGYAHEPSDFPLDEDFLSS